MLDSKINKTVYEITPGSKPLGSGYQISFTFFSNDQIRVYLTNGLTQVEVDSSNYSIIKDETIYKVAFLSDYVFPSDAIRLVIAREVAFQQNTNLINGELIDAEVLERALDLLAAMSQQLKEITDRVVLSPISENTQTIIPEKSDRAGRILGFDEHGDPTSILTSDIDQKLKQSLSAQEQVISLSSIIEGYRDQAYQSATNAQTSEENVLVKEEQVSGTLVQIQNIKQQIDNIENAVKLSEANAVEASNSASESANTASISESNARISESKSKESERNAASSASAALTSENNAKESETNAKNSENASAQSASNALSSENNVILKEEQISGILTQIQNLKQQIDDIKSAVELSETNAAESSSSAAESANTAKNLLDQADLNIIESIEQTLTSTESAGENQVTITQKNGNQSVFSIFNGKQGPAVPLVQTTGTSTTSAMSQNAVSEQINQLKSDIANDLLATNNKIITLTSRSRRNITNDLANLPTAIAEQNLEKYGYKIGDYFIGPSGYQYNLADMDSYYGGYNSYAVVGTHHCGIVVDTKSTCQWLSSGTATSYSASDLHAFLKGTVLNKIKSDMIALFGGTTGLEHLLSHTELDNGPYGWGTTWEGLANTYICALSESQVYGNVWSTNGYQTGTANKKLELFIKYRFNEIFGHTDVHLRSLRSESNSCRSNDAGDAGDGELTLSRRACGLILFY